MFRVPGEIYCFFQTLNHTLFEKNLRPNSKSARCLVYYLGSLPYVDTSTSKAPFSLLKRELLRSPQLSAFHSLAITQIGQELAAISLIIDEGPLILEPVFKDLTGVKQTDNGREGMSAE